MHFLPEIDYYAVVWNMAAQGAMALNLSRGDLG